MKWVYQSCLLVVLGCVAWSGCAPHYSVALTQDPNHTTFAQRNIQNKDDYLVDCKNNSNGTLYDCYVVTLPHN
jgi:hypothetical protein